MIGIDLKGQLSNQSLGGFIILAIVSIIIMQGINISDTDVPQIWQAMLGLPFEGDPKRLYLVEGLLPNSIGVIMLGLKASDRITLLLWWSVGIAALLSSFVYTVRAGTITVIDALLSVTFTRLVDTLSMWIGKFDPFLLSLLLLTTSNNRSVSRVSVVLAAFCHPLATIVSTAGNLAVAVSFKCKADYLPLLMSVPFAFLDIQLAHRLIPGMVDRSNLVLSTIGVVLNSAAECGIVTFVSVFLLPFLFIYECRSKIDAPLLGRLLPLLAWLVFAVVIGCFVVLDHTRVACLITLAPLITYLKIARSKGPSDATQLPRVFFLFATARLVIPHVAGDGFFLFNWSVLGKLVKSVLGVSLA